MTPEKAITILNDYDINFDGHTAEEIAEAFDMAIKAIRTIPKTEGARGDIPLQQTIPKMPQPCNDCIRRSDIGLTNLEILMCNGDYKEALKMLLDKIKKAPSVTPQPNKWIPISKETPSKCGWYITTTIYNETYCDYWDGNRFNRSEVIIAWMELPPSYKAESEEE